MREPIPVYGTPAWGQYNYERMKAANRGHNFEYWNEDKHGKMLENGWELHIFRTDGLFEKYATISEMVAKEIVEKLRNENNYARIVAGYSQNVQHIKMFSIIYKPKKQKK